MKIVLLSAIFALIAMNFEHEIQTRNERDENKAQKEMEENERRDHDSHALAALCEAQRLLREYDAENKANGWEVGLEYVQARQRIDSAVEKFSNFSGQGENMR